jgi:hypothetical protein
MELHSNVKKENVDLDRMFQRILNRNDLRLPVDFNRNKIEEQIERAWNVRQIL